MTERSGVSVCLCVCISLSMHEATEDQGPATGGTACLSPGTGGSLIQFFTFFLAIYI